MNTLFFIAIIFFGLFTSAGSVETQQISENDSQNDSQEMTSVNMADLTKLQFFNGMKTRSRKNKSVDQMTCAGGSAACSFTPDVIVCYNHGFDGVDYHWECKSRLPSDMVLGEISIECEGFSKTNDNVVLDGSCSLNYFLNKRRVVLQKNESQFINKLLSSTGRLVLIVLFLLFLMGIKRFFLFIWFLLLSPYHLCISLYFLIFYPNMEHKVFADKPNSNPFILDYYKEKQESAFYIILSWGFLGYLYALQTEKKRKPVEKTETRRV
ncbi:hypothetical protein WA158_007844 [Blastocystis sp. Blastoise]